MLPDWNIGAERTGRGEEKKENGSVRSFDFFSQEWRNRQEAQANPQTDVGSSRLFQSLQQPLKKNRAFLWYSRAWVKKKKKLKNTLYKIKQFYFNRSRLLDKCLRANKKGIETKHLGFVIRDRCFSAQFKGKLHLPNYRSNTRGFSVLRFCIWNPGLFLYCDLWAWKAEIPPVSSRLTFLSRACGSA